VHIARLRRKIDGPNLTKLIHTVRGVGFCLSDSELD
jgi:DNA-binding response OmpR family regulator